MKPKRAAHRIVLALAVLLAVTLIYAVHPTQATADDTKTPASTAHEPRAKNGKKLVTALDLMKVVNVGAPRIAPDGTRVASPSPDRALRLSRSRARHVRPSVHRPARRRPRSHALFHRAGIARDAPRSPPNPAPRRKEDRQTSARRDDAHAPAAAPIATRTRTARASCVRSRRPAPRGRA